MRIIKLLLLLSILSFVLNTKAQIACDSTSFSNKRIEALESLLLEATSKKLRKTSQEYTIAIRANIIHGSVPGTLKFTKEDVNLLINHVNSYFKNIGVTFYLLKDEVNNVYDSNYLDFKTSQESEIRKKYDIDNAINVYFFRTISDEKGNFLNGSAALPNLSTNSNRVFLSYLDKNESDFETLKNKVFLHELGHYFGLLHTFQDSNHENISKRELVSRDIGTGANCNITGDLICDTAADPFERLSTISSYDCAEKLPATLLDANGYSFSPPIDNIMSYQIRCGNVFTREQYQRMQNMFTIRFSPNASYKLIGNFANTITITSIDKKTVCEGESITIKYDKRGDFSSLDNFSLELSDENGENFNTINAAFNLNDEVKVTLPTALKASSNYRFRIVSYLPFVYSQISEPFTIHSKGELNLSLANEKVRPQNSTILFLNFTGSGPWKVTFDNGITLPEINSRNHQLLLQPLNTTTYKIINVIGKCGNLKLPEPIRLEVLEPNLVIQPEFKKEICEQTTFQIPISGLKKTNGLSPYKIKLSSLKETYVLNTIIDNNSLLAIAPSILNNNFKYQLSIDSDILTDFSAPIDISLSPISPNPTITSPINYCFNSIQRPLYAFGNNLKWYNSENDINSLKQITPSTSKAGVFHYYVTQTNANGCESKRSRVEVIVKQPVTATITGDNVINFGESSEVVLKFTGEVPYKVELSDGQQILANDPTLKTKVKPISTEVYTIKNAFNTCGEAFTSGSAKIVVLLPLGLENESGNDFTIFPNPVIDNEIYISVNAPEILQKNNSLQIINSQGKVIGEIPAIKFKIDEIFSLSISEMNLVNASYFLKIKNDDYSFSKKFVVSK